MPHPGLLGDYLLLSSITKYEFGAAPFQRLKLISLSSYSSLFIYLVYTACYWHNLPIFNIAVHISVAG